MLRQFWHGGRRWTGRPEVQPARTGRCECGPGIYLTTSYPRARQYATGGKVTTLVALEDSEVRWLEDASLPMSELLDFLKQAPRLPKRNRVRIDLQNLVNHNLSLKDACPVSYLVNLLINADALAGKIGPQLAEWLAKNGIDASRYSPGGQEQWIIVFNPDIILRYEVVPASMVSMEQYELPRLG